MPILKIGSAIALLLAATYAREAITSAPPPAQAESRPVPRRHHAVAYDARSERVVMYGGATSEGETLDDMWSWDGRAWTLLGRSVPSAGHLLFTDEDGTLVLAGGTLGITAPWDSGAWQIVMREPRRVGAAGAQDVPRGRFVLHGGSPAPRDRALRRHRSRGPDAGRHLAVEWHLVAARRRRRPARAFRNLHGIRRRSWCRRALRRRDRR